MVCVVQQGSGGPDVNFEDQENINAFNRLFQRSAELEAELKVKKVGPDLNLAWSVTSILSETRSSRYENSKISK